MDRPANAANEAALNRWFPTTDCKNASRRIPPSRTRILAEAGALLGRVMAIPAGLLDLRDISIYGAPEIVNAQFIDAMEDEIRRTMTTDYQKAPQIHRCRQGEDLTLRGQATIVIRTLVPTIHERGSLIGDA